MRAMVLKSCSQIEASPLHMLDLPVPEPEPGQVRMRVHCCAVCRTDLHVVEGDLPQQRLPLVPGHQIVGVVEELGPNCRRFKVGQRVGVAWLRHTCGHCRFCTSGRENLCESSLFTGYHADGGYAEYAVVPEDFAYEIPQPFSDLDAAPLLCGGIIGYRALLRCEVPQNGRLALFGFGSSAHVILQIAIRRGCRLFVVTRGKERQRMALDMGAAWAGTTADELPEKMDGAIIFAPNGQLVPPALEKLDKGAKLALAGIYMSDIPSMNYDRHIFYERDIRSVTANTREDGKALLAEAATIPIRPQVTTYHLEDANVALQDLKAGRLSGTGVLVMQ